MPEKADARNRHLGRKARKGRTDGTRPGKIFTLALLSAVPIVFLFIIGPLLRPDVALPIERYPGWRFLFLVVTPALAATAIVMFYRSPAWAREHNAAKAGRFLSFANLALWLVYGGLYVSLVWMRENAPSP